MSKARTVTGGRPATTGVIPGRLALSVGHPNQPAPAGWAWTPLIDVARLESGHTPSRRHPEYWDGDIPWIGIRDATENHGRILSDTEQHVTQAGIDNSSARVLPPNTVCLSRTASIGFVVVTGRAMATSQDFVNWVCGPDIEWRFLQYVLLAERDSYAQFASGTTHQTIYFPEVKAFHICLPPLREQRRISAILGALDDKIELNRQLNRSLRDSMQTAYQSLMTDTSAAGAAQPVTRIGELADIVGGSTPSTAESRFWHPAVHSWATPKDLSQLPNHVLLSTERRISSAGLSQISSGLLPSGTVLMSSRAPIGYLAISEIPVAINQGFIAMKPRSSVSNLFLLCWAAASQDVILSRANGSTFLEISKAAFRPIEVRVPSQERMAAFERLVRPLHLRIVAAERESNTLRELRDALLPSLLSGQLEVAA